MIFGWISFKMFIYCLCAAFYHICLATRGIFSTKKPRQYSPRGDMALYRQRNANTAAHVLVKYNAPDAGFILKISLSFRLSILQIFLTYWFDFYMESSPIVPLKSICHSSGVFYFNHEGRLSFLCFQITVSCIGKMNPP